VPRIARLVVPGIPHHVTQRGNRRQRTFFCDDDYRAYLTLLSRFSALNELEVWCWALMPNHVHLLAMPSHEAALADTIGRTHEAYTRIINEREGWQGYLWQGRFASFPMEERHLRNAARYTLLNPVTAGLCRRPEDWPWSSARAHRSGRSDGLTKLEPLAGRVRDWDDFLSAPLDTVEENLLERHMRTGRPLGDDAFLEQLEARTGRRLVPRSPGRRPAAGKVCAS
jgi:putative transposase